MKRVFTWMLILALLSLSMMGMAFGEADTGEKDTTWEIMRVLRSEKDQVAFSPFSLLLASAMAVEGAAGETRTELMSAMGLDEVALNRLSESLKSLYEAGVRTANAAFIAEGMETLSAYEQALQERWHAQLFGGMKLDELNERVNRWVSEQTDGQIHVLLNQPPNPLTKLMLVNALTLCAEWQTPFADAGEESFYTSQGTVNASYMIRRGTLKYAGIDGLQVVQLPYKEEGISMTVLLPNEEMGVDDLLNTLCDQGDFWRSALVDTEMDLTMPRFSIEDAHSLEQTLRQLGVQQAFGSEADFSFINGNTDLCLGSVQQRVRMDVDDQGTTASASTSAAIQNKSIQLPAEKSMIVNRPFLVLIEKEGSEAPLFVASIENPTGE